MGEIRVLDKRTAELIAAGEVIERPASIVKELLENSVDAGAKHITVEIKSGGVELIRVTDDGKGISFEDAPTAFLRHATSKVRNANDLNKIFTLGFRGEALASICAVSRVTMITRTVDSDIGCHIEYAGGELLNKEEAGCPVGTTIIVKNVFYNTPARMKFLKKDVSEANAVAAIVEKIALSNPDISFKFIRDGKIDIQTVGDGQLFSAIHCIFGKSFADSLVPVNCEKNGISVEGYISKAVYSRAKRSMQYFFLNGRTVKNLTMMVALEEAYKGSIMVGKFPACVLLVSVSPAIVDVNVHPTKTEIRFSDEKIIYDAVYFACKSALSNDSGEAELEFVGSTTQKSLQDAVKFIDFTTSGEQTVLETKPSNNENTAILNEQVAAQIENLRSLFSEPDKSESILKFKDSTEASTHNGVVQITLSENPIKSDEKNIQTEVTPITEPVVNEVNVEAVKNKRFDGAKIIGELFKTYILLECDDAMYLVDKHAAHERLIYNSLKAQKNQIQKQYLLEPVISRFSREEFDVLILHKDIVSEMGFEIDDFGNSSIIIRSVPTFISSAEAATLLSEIASNLQNTKKDIEPQIIDDIYHTIACRSAIKAHDKSSAYELSFLIDCLIEESEVKFCPHGRPVTVKILKTDIEKRFGRIQ